MSEKQKPKIVGVRAPEQVPPGSPGVLGLFVDVVAGPHKGRRGSFEKIERVHANGTPDRALIRTRDADSLYLGVKYEHLRHTDFKGGR